ncbi:MAG TPA: hypothetical protein VMW79_05400 [Anaerolineae bacterium]|nr:hypothetical protein [Anaerolineae bacterium]
MAKWLVFRTIGDRAMVPVLVRRDRAMEGVLHEHRSGSAGFMEGRSVCLRVHGVRAAG